MEIVGENLLELSLCFKVAIKRKLQNKRKHEMLIKATFTKCIRRTADCSNESVTNNSLKAI